MDALERLRAAILDAAKDIRLNLQAVLRGGSVSEPQRNVYYRFRHMVGKPVYGEKAAGRG